MLPQGYPGFFGMPPFIPGPIPGMTIPTGPSSGSEAQNGPQTLHHQAAIFAQMQQQYYAAAQQQQYLYMHNK